MSNTTNNNTIDLTVLSNEQLEAMLLVLPKESEITSKIKGILSNSQTAEALVSLKRAVVSNTDGIVKVADATVGKTITTVTKVSELYGPVVFEKIGSVVDSINSALDAKLRAKAIRKELESRYQK
jgi:predicted lactoylglutathione lyase